MPYWAARLILAALSTAGVVWTISILFRGLPQSQTTSYCIRSVCDTCPQVTVLIMLVAYSLLCDALPETNRWVVLGCVVIPLYCLGHSCWGWP